MSDSLVQTTAVTVRQAGIELGGISHATVYRLIRSGQLKSFRIGKRRLISRKAIDDYVAQAEIAEESVAAA